MSSPRVNGASPVHVLEEASRNNFYTNRLEAIIYSLTCLKIRSLTVLFWSVAPCRSILAVMHLDIPKVSLSYLIVSLTSQEKKSSRHNLITRIVVIIFSGANVKTTAFKSNAWLKYLADSSCLNSVETWLDSCRFAYCTFKADKWGSVSRSKTKRAPFS